MEARMKGSGPIHCRPRFGAFRASCGLVLQPWHETTIRPRNITCEACKAVKAAHRKSAEVRAKAAGLRG